MGSTMNDESKSENELQPGKTGTHSRMKTALLVVGVLAVGTVMALTAEEIGNVGVGVFRSVRGPRHPKVSVDRRIHGCWIGGDDVHSLQEDDARPRRIENGVRRQA